MKESEKGLLAAAVFIGIFFWSKVKAPNPSGGISSRTPQIPSGPAIATRFSENSKGVVVYRQPTKGGIFNALNPVNSGLTASNQKSAQQIREARAAEFKYMMSLPEAERNAELAKRGLTPKL